jgi:hypothetical protein
MTVCGKPGKTIKLFTHPCHKPWKSLRDSHIPSALRLIISIQFSNPKRSLPQLPIPPTFRLILQLEKTEVRKIYLVTAAVARFFIVAQRNDSWAADTRTSRLKSVWCVKRLRVKRNMRIKPRCRRLWWLRLRPTGLRAVRGRPRCGGVTSPDGSGDGHPVAVSFRPYASLDHVARIVERV